MNNKDKINKIKSAIISNSKDAHFASELVSELLSAQKQYDNMNKDICVDISEIKESVDFGAYLVKRTSKGMIFECRGGLYTFVDMRMTSVYGMLNQMLKMSRDPSEDPERKELEDSFCNACAYIFQTPIFASISELILFDTATTLLKNFNEYANEHYTNAKEQPETEQDIRDNIAAEQTAEALENLASEPIPDDI